MMEEPSPFVFAGFNHDAAVRFALGNTEDEIETMLATMDAQQLLSFYTYLQTLEDRRNARVSAVVRGRMDCARKLVSLATFGALDAHDHETAAYLARSEELRRVQTIMSKRVGALLAPARSYSALHARRGM